MAGFCSGMVGMEWEVVRDRQGEEIFLCEKVGVSGMCPCFCDGVPKGYSAIWATPLPIPHPKRQAIPANRLEFVH
jgi:hypothetical protein